MSENKPTDNPRIVVLDGYTLNPGDLDWTPLASLGDFAVYDRSSDDQVMDRAQDAACVLTNKIPLNAQRIDALPKLKYIGVLATGYNVVDTGAARKRGIPVTNVPVYGTDSVAQHTAALMLELARRVSIHNQAVHEGKWAYSVDWCFSLAPITELAGRTLGIVGLGRIGRAFAKIGAAMGMKLIAHTGHWPSDEQLEGLEVQRVELDELFAQADVVSLHCPLTKDNRHMVNADRLATMKPTALLLNTSRGPLVDESALAEALHAGRLGGAGLDVLAQEPPAADNPLFGAPNCIITPHIAWYARAARERLLQQAAENLAAFLKGEPVNVVN